MFDQEQTWVLYYQPVGRNMAVSYLVPDVMQQKKKECLAPVRAGHGNVRSTYVGVLKDIRTESFRVWCKTCFARQNQLMSQHVQWRIQKEKPHNLSRFVCVKEMPTQHGCVWNGTAVDYKKGLLVLVSTSTITAYKAWLLQSGRWILISGYIQSRDIRRIEGTC